MKFSKALATMPDRLLENKKLSLIHMDKLKDEDTW